MRANEFACFAFILPQVNTIAHPLQSVCIGSHCCREGWSDHALVWVQLLLFSIPVVGPLLFVFSSAAAAFLADFLDRLPKNKQYHADLKMH